MLIMFNLCVALLPGQTIGYVLALGCAMLTAMCMSMYFVASMTLLQLAVAGTALRGRVMGIYTICFSLIPPRGTPGRGGGGRHLAAHRGRAQRLRAPAGLVVVLIALTQPSIRRLDGGRDGTGRPGFAHVRARVVSEGGCGGNSESMTTSSRHGSPAVTRPLGRTGSRRCRRRAPPPSWSTRLPSMMSLIAKPRCQYTMMPSPSSRPPLAVPSTTSPDLAVQGFAGQLAALDHRMQLPALAALLPVVDTTTLEARRTVAGSVAMTHP